SRSNLPEAAPGFLSTLFVEKFSANVLELLEPLLPFGSKVPSAEIPVLRPNPGSPEPIRHRPPRDRDRSPSPCLHGYRATPVLPIRPKARNKTPHELAEPRHVEALH